MTAALSIRRVTSSDQADYIEVRFDDENGRRVAAATMSLEAFGLAVTGRSEVPVELVTGAPSPSPGLAAQEVERRLRVAQALYGLDDCGVWLNDPGPHDGDCTHQCHTCRRCLQDEYLRHADVVIAALSAPRPSQPKGETR